MIRCIPSAFILLALSLMLTNCTDEFEPIGDIDPDVPFPVTDLAGIVSNDTTFLVWTATGDDGPNGTATSYDLRMHPETLVDSNWDEAVRLENPPRPSPAGSTEKFILAAGGTSLPTMYYALKVIDDRGNTSALSNVAFVDLIPPTTVTDLEATRVADNNVLLRWTAPADDGPGGRAARYEVRAGPEPLTEENWHEATPFGGTVKPAAAGEPQLFHLTGLAPQTQHHVALRSWDAAGNLSALSNVVSFETSAPPLGWWDGFAGLTISGGPIESLHVHGDTLFVGGLFKDVSDLPSRGFVSWDGTGWHGYGNGMAAGEEGTRVRGMASFGEDLYLFGSFTSAGGVPCNNLARWTGTAFESLGNPLALGFPTSLHAFQDDLYIGWRMGPTSSTPFDYFQKYDGFDFNSLGWEGDNGPFITDMTIYGNELVLVGDLRDVDGLATESVIGWDGSNWTAIGPDLEGGRYWEPVPYAACVYDGDLYVGGDFIHAGDQLVNGIARWDGNSWHDLAGGLGDLGAVVYDMIVYKGYLIVVGDFETAGGQVVNNIARWNGIFWESLGGGLTGDGIYMAQGKALAVYQGSLYVGGDFNAVDGSPSPALARWDLD